MRYYLIALFTMMWAASSMAEPASDETFDLKQPDGSIIEARLVGDEHFHVLQTADGVILQKDALGYYAYADKTGESSGRYAQDKRNRNQSDVQFLSGLDQESIYQKLLAETPAEETFEYGIPKFANPKIQRMPTPNTKLTLGEPRVLVVLLQFSDVKFKSADPQKQITEMLNKEGYNEFHHEGSARDYFIKNSMGVFRPTFDVYGPVTVPGTRESYGGVSGDKRFSAARTAFSQAVDTLLRLDSIDFAKYDNDKDKVVDFIYFIYAGVGASSSGVVESIWPHAGSMSKQLGTNLRISRYACSNEISGKAYKMNKSTSTPNGIGTFVHEFSHVLGLPDLYDIKGENTRKTPHGWSLMAHGSYSCPSNTDYYIQGCTPPYYSAFERMSVGWMAAPEELNINGAVILNKIEENFAYSITNPENPDEMFLLEYRTHKTWDAGQPTSGMLIWHIDYSDSVWKKRVINTDGNHMHVDIEEAYPESGTTATSSDVFPGSQKVTSFNKFIFWNNKDMKISLTNITEASDREFILFNVDMTVRSSSSVAFSSSAMSSSSSITSSSSNGSVSSSSVQESSSSEIISSSASSESSSSITSSSSIESNSSSSVQESSSSETISSSSEIESNSSSSTWESSSSEQALSSSETQSSSSSEFPVIIAKAAMPHPVHIMSQGGMIHVQTPLQGTKQIRVFTPNGQLLFETAMEGTDYQFPLPSKFGKQNVVIFVSKGKTTLSMRMISTR